MLVFLYLIIYECYFFFSDFVRVLFENLREFFWMVVYYLKGYRVNFKINEIIVNVFEVIIKVL